MVIQCSETMRWQRVWRRPLFGGSTAGWLHRMRPIFGSDLVRTLACHESAVCPQWRLRSRRPPAEACAYRQTIHVSVQASTFHVSMYPCMSMSISARGRVYVCPCAKLPRVPDYHQPNSRKRQVILVRFVKKRRDPHLPRGNPFVNGEVSAALTDRRPEWQTPPTRARRAQRRNERADRSGGRNRRCSPSSCER